MTKLLYCDVCQNIVQLKKTPRIPVWCDCKRHAAWWENPSAGDVRLHDAQAVRHGGHTNGVPHAPAGWVLGLHNALLTSQIEEVTTEAFVTRVLASTPDNYIFRQAGSLIVKFRPGVSDDSRWAENLPKRAGA